jgi:hypothetical protein
MSMPFEQTLEALGVMHVHVENADEIKGTSVTTQEKEAQHYTCSTFTLPQGEIIGTGVTAIEPTQILQLDPLRKRAVLGLNGVGQVILAHSLQQATSLAQNIQQAADEGALYTVPGTITVEATGPLWAVGIAATQQTGNVVAGSNAAFAAGAAGTATLPAGSTLTGFDLTVSAATAAGLATVTVSNVIGGNYTYSIQEETGGGVTMSIRYPGSGLPATSAAAVPTVAIGTLASGGSGTINIYGTTPNSGNLQVGVTQERRNS